MQFDFLFSVASSDFYVKRQTLFDDLHTVFEEGASLAISERSRQCYNLVNERWRRKGI